MDVDHDDGASDSENVFDPLHSIAIDDAISQTMAPSNDFYSHEGMETSDENGYFTDANNTNEMAAGDTFMPTLPTEHVRNSFKELSRLQVRT